MSRPCCLPPSSGLLLSFTFPLLIVWLLSVDPSAAQTERRYILGETISYSSEKTPALSRSDFVAAPDVDWTHVAVPAFTGVVGGGLGLFFGAGAGVVFAEASGCTSLGCIGYSVLGAAVGETVGLSSGVYLGTERRGSYLLTLLGGLATTAVVLGVGSDVVGDDAITLTLIALPILQLATTIPIARSD